MNDWCRGVQAEITPLIDRYNAEIGGELCAATDTDLGVGPLVACWLPTELADGADPMDCQPYAFAVSPTLNQSIGGEQQNVWGVGFTDDNGVPRLTVMLKPDAEVEHLSAALLGAVYLMLAYYSAGGTEVIGS